MVTVLLKRSMITAELRNFTVHTKLDRIAHNRTILTNIINEKVFLFVHYFFTLSRLNFDRDSPSIYVTDYSVGDEGCRG